MRSSYMKKVSGVELAIALIIVGQVAWANPIAGSNEKAVQFCEEKFRDVRGLMFSIGNGQDRELTRSTRDPRCVIALVPNRWANEGQIIKIKKKEKNGDLTVLGELPILAKNFVNSQPTQPTLPEPVRPTQPTTPNNPPAAGGNGAVRPSVDSEMVKERARRAGQEMAAVVASAYGQVDIMVESVLGGVAQSRRSFSNTSVRDQQIYRQEYDQSYRRGFSNGQAEGSKTVDRQVIPLAERNFANQIEIVRNMVSNPSLELLIPSLFPSPRFDAPPTSLQKSVVPGDWHEDLLAAINELVQRGGMRITGRNVRLGVTLEELKSGVPNQSSLEMSWGRDPSSRALEMWLKLERDSWIRNLPANHLADTSFYLSLEQDPSKAELLRTFRASFQQTFRVNLDKNMENIKANPLLEYREAAVRISREKYTEHLGMLARAEGFNEGQSEGFRQEFGLAKVSAVYHSAIRSQLEVMRFITNDIAQHSVKFGTDVAKFYTSWDQIIEGLRKGYQEAEVTNRNLRESTDSEIYRSAFQRGQQAGAIEGARSGQQRVEQLASELGRESANKEFISATEEGRAPQRDIKLAAPLQSFSTQRGQGSNHRDILRQELIEGNREIARMMGVPSTTVFVTTDDLLNNFGRQNSLEKAWGNSPDSVAFDKFVGNQDQFIKVDPSVENLRKRLQRNEVLNRALFENMFRAVFRKNFETSFRQQQQKVQSQSNAQLVATGATLSNTVTREYQRISGESRGYTEAFALAAKQKFDEMFAEVARQSFETQFNELSGRAVLSDLRFVGYVNGLENSDGLNDNTIRPGDLLKLKLDGRNTGGKDATVSVSVFMNGSRIDLGQITFAKFSKANGALDTPKSFMVPAEILSVQFGKPLFANEVVIMINDKVLDRRILGSLNLETFLQKMAMTAVTNQGESMMKNLLEFVKKEWTYAYDNGGDQIGVQRTLLQVLAETVPGTGLSAEVKARLKNRGLVGELRKIIGTARPGWFSGYRNDWDAANAYINKIEQALK